VLLLLLLLLQKWWLATLQWLLVLELWL